MVTMWLGMHSVLFCLLALLVSLALSLCLGRPYIRQLQKAQFKQVIRKEGPESHLKKQGTPTMGGGLIVAVATITTLLFSNWHSLYVWLILGVLVATAVLGWFDDYQKVTKANTKGLSGKAKLFWQIMIAAIALLIAYRFAPSPAYTALSIPFIKSCTIALGGWFVVLGVLVIVGTSNAVNLTDGLDGLVSMPIVLVLLGLLVCSSLMGSQGLSAFFHLQYMPSLADISIVICSLIGAVLGFLWFNVHPAEMFMGDLGSLSLGAVIGMMAMMLREELLLVIIGGLFVAEALSVIIQVASFRCRQGKRVFKMAPFHHHFELSGWAESRVVMRFWWVSLLLLLIGMTSLFV